LGEYEVHQFFPSSRLSFIIPNTPLLLTYLLYFNKKMSCHCVVEEKIDQLYDLIDGINVCMMTTRREDGFLVSRAMGTQTHSHRTKSGFEGVDLWFVTNAASHKLDELNYDPHVNLAYYREGTNDWVSVSGTAKVSFDKALIKKLYTPELRAWFGDLGDGVHTGGPEDPRICIILVEAHTVTYSKSNTWVPTVFKVIKGMVSGEKVKVAEVRSLSEAELKHSQTAQH